MESSAGVTEKRQQAKAVILHGSEAQIPREGKQLPSLPPPSHLGHACSPDSPFSPMPGGTQTNFIHRILAVLEHFHPHGACHTAGL